jgi:hypothetical protein
MFVVSIAKFLIVPLNSVISFSIGVSTEPSSLKISVG